jgi:hypothetical protein
MKETDERKKVTWELSNVGMLTAHHLDRIDQSFNLTRLDKGGVPYMDMSAQQKDSFAYGVKQQLSDATARSKDEKLDDDGKRIVMDATFESMIDGTYLETSRKQREKEKTEYTEDEIVDMAISVNSTREVVINLLKMSKPKFKIVG